MENTTFSGRNGHCNGSISLYTFNVGVSGVTLPDRHCQIHIDATTLCNCSPCLQVCHAVVLDRLADRIAARCAACTGAPVCCVCTQPCFEQF
eukprot:IDg18870t1